MEIRPGSILIPGQTVLARRPCLARWGRGRFGFGFLLHDLRPMPEEHDLARSKNERDPMGLVPRGLDFGGSRRIGGNARSQLHGLSQLGKRREERRRRAQLARGGVGLHDRAFFRIHFDHGPVVGDDHQPLAESHGARRRSSGKLHPIALRPPAGLICVQIVSEARDVHRSILDQGGETDRGPGRPLKALIAVREREAVELAGVVSDVETVPRERGRGVKSTPSAESPRFRAASRFERRQRARRSRDEDLSAE